MRATLAILAGLFVCGVIDQSIGSRLPAQWGRSLVGWLVWLWGWGSTDGE